MKKQIFELTITKENRVLLFLFLLPIIILIGMVIKIEMNSIVLAVTSALIFLSLSYYFVIGNLTITIQGQEIHFEWKKKWFFNYNEIKSINISQIQAVVIDDGKFLRKIITSEKSLNLGTSYLQPKDSKKLIKYFNEKSTVENFVIITSWQNLLKKFK